MCEARWQAPLPAETFSPLTHLINILEHLLYIIYPVVYTIEGTSNETLDKIWFMPLSDSNTMMKVMYVRACCHVNGVVPPHCPLSEISGVGREAFDRCCPQAGMVPQNENICGDHIHTQYR